MAQDDDTLATVGPEFFEKTGRRPRYNANWHLRTLRVVEDVETFESSAWKTVLEHLEGDHMARRVRVVLIDTPVARAHPLLPRVEQEGDHPAGAHGTALAGLIAAFPAEVTLTRPKILRDSDDPVEAETEKVVLPYFGVNPFAEIVSVPLGAEPDPKQVLGVLKTAQEKLKGVRGVVVIADTWDRRVTAPPDGRQPRTSFDPDAYGQPVPDTLAARGDETTKKKTNDVDPAGWDAVNRALDELSEVAIVLCAAGNRPRSRPVYPASQSRKDAGPWVVAACRPDGTPVSYSASYKKLEKHHRPIMTLSSEHPRFDRRDHVVDPWAIPDEDVPDLEHAPEGKGFPPLDIVATDMPGRGGYNPSPYKYAHEAHGPYLEVASLFCRFSGTSAATALAAGLVSLALALRMAEDETPSKPVQDGLFDLPMALSLVDEKMEEWGAKHDPGA